jgi:3-methyladenine DNA glycosylase AlkD
LELIWPFLIDGRSNKFIMHKKIIADLLSIFETNANHAKAIQMKAYMRNRYEFFGLPMPLRRKIALTFMKQLLAIKEDHFEEIIKTLWNHPCREVHYFAMEYAYKAKKIWTKDTIQLFEWMITTNSWWDTVDYIASNLIGNFFIKYPELIKANIRQWNNSQDFWLHRVSLIFQLKHGAKTDQELLFKQCKKYADVEEFFIRKAIGWALRQYSKFNPTAVRKFIQSNKLSSLSISEGSKYI